MRSKLVPGGGLLASRVSLSRTPRSRAFGIASSSFACSAERTDTCAARSRSTIRTRVGTRGKVAETAPAAELPRLALQVRSSSCERALLGPGDHADVEELLRGYDQDLEFAVLERFPPEGSAMLVTDVPNFCPTVQAELESLAYVESVSCQPIVEG